MFARVCAIVLWVLAYDAASGPVYESNPFLQVPSTYKVSPSQVHKGVSHSNVYVVLPSSGQQLHHSLESPTVTLPSSIGVQPHVYDCANPTSTLHVQHQPEAVVASQVHQEESVNAHAVSVAHISLTVNTPELNRRCLRSTGLFLGTSCNKFVSCLNGTATELSCPDGLLFNADGLYCDRPENVQCDGERSAGVIDHQNLVLPSSTSSSPIHTNLVHFSVTPPQVPYAQAQVSGVQQGQSSQSLANANAFAQSTTSGVHGQHYHQNQHQEQHHQQNQQQHYYEQQHTQQNQNNQQYQYQQQQHHQHQQQNNQNNQYQQHHNQQVSNFGTQQQGHQHQHQGQQHVQHQQQSNEHNQHQHHQQQQTGTTVSGHEQQGHQQQGHQQYQHNQQGASVSAGQVAATAGTSVSHTLQNTVSGNQQHQHQVHNQQQYQEHQHTQHQQQQFHQQNSQHSQNQHNQQTSQINQAISGFPQVSAVLIEQNQISGNQQQHHQEQQNSQQQSHHTGTGNSYVETNQISGGNQLSEDLHQNTQEINSDFSTRCLSLRGQFASDTCHTFLNCWGGVATEQSCPDGLLFNTKGYCDFAENVNCAGRRLIGSQQPVVAAPVEVKPPTPSSFPTSSFTPTVSPVLVVDPTTPYTPTVATLPAVAAPELKSKCLNARGQFPSTTCNKFVNCWDGIILEQDCPEGFLFSTKGYCDFAQNVQCGDRPVDSKNTEASTENSECPLENGTFRDKNKCNSYYTCSANKVAARYECPEGLNYNDYIGVCDYAYRVDCSKEPLIFPQRSNLGPQLRRGDQCPVDFATYRDTQNCGIYYTCVSKTIVATYECPAGFSFNDDIGVCDYAEKVDCSRAPKIFQVPSNVVPEITDEIKQKLDTCAPGTMFPLNPQCTSVCLCRQGVAEIVQCPAGLAYDTETDKCVLPHLAKC